MHRRNAGPPEIQWQLIPPSGKIVQFSVYVHGMQVQLTLFGGHLQSLTEAGFGETLLAQIVFYHNHEFHGGSESTYFRYRTTAGTRYRVTVLFTENSIEVTDLEAEVPAMTA